MKRVDVRIDAVPGTALVSANPNEVASLRLLYVLPSMSLRDVKPRSRAPNEPREVQVHLGQALLPLMHPLKAPTGWKARHDKNFALLVLDQLPRPRCPHPTASSATKKADLP